MSFVLQVARGGHRKGVLATHTCCAGNTWYVDLAEEEMKKTLGKSSSSLAKCKRLLDCFN